MDRERLIQHLNERYCSRREMITRIPLGVKPDALWQELLNLRRSGSTALPLYSCHGMPYWYVTTDKMIAASEKIVEALLENETEFDPYMEAPPVSTLEEVFYTSFVEGSQMTMQAAMEFLTGEQPPRDIEEQMIANNRMAGSYASGNLYRRIDLELLCELASILTEGMDRGGRDFRNTEEVDFASADGEAFSFHVPLMIRDSVNELCDFLSAQDVHPLIKAAVAQAYLLILRPFPEGNERLARVLSSMILLRAGYTFFSDVSLSALIARKGYAYYGAMVNILREENGGDLTYFIEYYLELLSRAVDERRLRAQRREEKARQAEVQLARTPLAPPVSADHLEDQTQPEAVLKEEQSPEPASQQAPVSSGEEQISLEGFLPVSGISDDRFDFFTYPDNGENGLGRVIDMLYSIAESGGPVMKSCALVLLGFIHNGVESFTAEDIQNKLGVTPKQSGNMVTNMKEKGIVESSEERVGRFVRYRFSSDLPPLKMQDYDSELIELVKELRLLSRSPKDKRIGQTIFNCMPKGIITALDYEEHGGPERLSNDMSLPVQMGIVTQLDNGVYRINRKLTGGPPLLNTVQKTYLTVLYNSFRGDVFTREMAVAALKISKTNISTYLHQYVMLRLIECIEKTTYEYRLLVNPDDYPALFAKQELDSADPPEVPILSQEEDAVPDSLPILESETASEPPECPDLYADEVHELIQTLAESDACPRDRRLADVVKNSLKKGVILHSDYEKWGYTPSMWLSDMKLARQLGIATRLSTDVYCLNKRLKPELQPHQRKTVSAIYETFGDQEFSSEMFIATLNYSLSHTYASLHKLTLLRILDQRSTDEGSRYQLLVSPEDHPECFEPAA